jgi:hypothetical protein
MRDCCPRNVRARRHPLLFSPQSLIPQITSQTSGTLLSTSPLKRTLPIRLFENAWTLESADPNKPIEYETERTLPSQRLHIISLPLPKHSPTTINSLWGRLWCSWHPLAALYLLAKLLVSVGVLSILLLWVRLLAFNSWDPKSDRQTKNNSARPKTETRFSLFTYLCHLKGQKITPYLPTYSATSLYEMPTQY